MSPAPRRLTTDEQRERLYAAKHRGSICVWCGRTLGDDEPVYVERVAVERKSSAAPGMQWNQPAGYRDAILGAECASAAFLARTKERTPEGCESCGRPVYYEVGREGRQRVTCSRRCAFRVSKGS